MTIDPQKLLDWKIPTVERTYTRRDTMLYALGVGLGADPCDSDQLRFVYEENLLALPTMAVIFGYPGAWYADPATGVTYEQVLHGEQGISIHRPIPVEGCLVGVTRVTGVADKGKRAGALIYAECAVHDKHTGELICTHTTTSVCRADGGFGGGAGPAPERLPMPGGPPDLTCDLPTAPQAALIYRLSGDHDALHADPAYARRCGFSRPILHGRCTFGIVGHALLRLCCGYDPSRLSRMRCRFSAPVYPGETLRTEVWSRNHALFFRANVTQRAVTVIDNGFAEITPG